MYELQMQLKSIKKGDQRDAVKKVIAAMTVGKDVSALFPEVVNCMQADNLELKKLTYLYIMNYAKSQPEQAIMAVNSFVKDCQDPNPLIRALAVRTMGCIRVNKITEYLCDPLRMTLKDSDPYVRKTAAVCVAKLYDIDQDLVKEQGFIEALQELLSDANPMVVANAVAALSEMHEAQPGAGIFNMTQATVSKLLTALNECTEWGQIFILDSLAIYAPKDQRELQSICERVSPRLQHVNAAVVLSAVKVVMKLLDGLEDQEYIDQLVKKLAPPLVTLLSSEAEVQYVALRNINLIVQKRPQALKDHMKVFFVKYNDPIYVKLEKLDVMIRLASQANLQQVLAELKEYAAEVDVDFVRKAVRAIGRCAIKIESSAQRCVDTLIDLINTKVNYVVQEAIIVIKDIFRKYPNKYESIIAVLCENLDSLDEPEAKAAMIWIVGEYADRIENADELLESFFDNFVEEAPQVQLALVTGTVKLFLKRPAGTQELVQRILLLATQECDNPDLRDRGFIYWRLLRTDPASAKAVVLAEKPLISEETDLLEPTLLDELICHVSSLASVYHKPPSTFVDTIANRRPLAGAGSATGKEEVTLIGEGMPDLVGGGGAAVLAPPAAAGGAVDLLGGALGGLDFGGASPAAAAPAAMVLPPTVWLDDGDTLAVSGCAMRANGALQLKCTVTNKGATPLSGVAFRFNKNSFALTTPADLPPLAVGAGQSVDTIVPLPNTGPLARMDPLNKVEVAIASTEGGMKIFSIVIPFYALLSEGGKCDPTVFIEQWGALGTAAEKKTMLANVRHTTGASIVAACTANNIFEINTQPPVDGKEVMFMSMKFINNLVVLAEVTVYQGQVQIALRTKTADLFAACHQVYTDVLCVQDHSSSGSLF
jgi:AP-1 complex subunit beta-1